MWRQVWIVLLCMNIVCTSENLLKFDEEVLNHLAIASRTDSYNQFRLLRKYQCAIACLKDKGTCAGYSFDDGNNTCSLFEDSTKIMQKDLIELVRDAL